MKKRSRKSNAPKKKIRKFDIEGDFDALGIYRLKIPMEAYDIICHYRNLIGKLAEFSGEVVPMLTGDAYSRKSIIRVLNANGEDPKMAERVIEMFLIELRHFQLYLEKGFSKLDWVNAGEAYARDRHKNIRKTE